MRDLIISEISTISGGHFPDAIALVTTSLVGGLFGALCGIAGGPIGMAAGFAAGVASGAASVATYDAAKMKYGDTFSEERFREYHK